MIPNILSIAGSDPSGGAGIQADIKAISANGGYAMAVTTAVTAQNTRGVQAVQFVDHALVSAQIASIRDDIRIDAVKIGLLGNAAIIDVVAEVLTALSVPIVLDPVMVAKSGDRLLAPEVVKTLRAQLLPHATVLTPNLPEASDLLGVAEAKSPAEMEEQAKAILELGPGAVLLKGGHLASGHSPDLLATSQGLIWLDGPRHPTRNTHGTGCTLSAALATQLAHSHPLPEAARITKHFVSEAIRAADDLDVGEGSGPVHHFHGLWPKTAV
jgi:hydroxymethylpyrimidine/phosphomethylpyrimidine kinase